MVIENPNLTDLLTILEENNPESIIPLLPEGEPVLPHYHVTEVARIQKDFIDCGGTVRCALSAQLQLLTATDFEHRLSAKKLAGIIRKSESLLGDDPLPLTLEYGQKVAVVYPVSKMTWEDGKLTLQMETPSTSCLAPDTCGLDPEESRVTAFRVKATVYEPKSGRF